MERLSEIRETLRGNPCDPWALKGAARYYLNDGQYKQAQIQFTLACNYHPRLLPLVVLDYEQAIENSPQNIGLRLSLCGFLIKTGEIDQAILELEELLEISPTVEAYNILGRIYIKSERLDESIALLEQSIARGIKDVNLTETLAAAYLERGRDQEAIRFYEEILLQKPGDKRILRILGELYANHEEYNRSARAYGAMFSDDPEVTREVLQRLADLLKKVEGSIEIREIMADIYMKTLNPEAAVEKLHEIARLEPAKLSDVALKLRSILKNYPDLPSAIMALGEVLRLQGDYSEAVELYYQLAKVKPELLPEIANGYRAVLAVCPDQVLAHAYLGEALLTENKVEEALNEFAKMVDSDAAAADMVVQKCREILKSNPQLLSAHLVLGRAYLIKGDLQRAVVEAEGVIALEKNSIEAYLLLGDTLNKLNLGRKAIEAFHTALILDPFSFAVHEKYRQAKECELDHELELIGEKISQDPGKTALHLDLAKLLIKKGEREGAIRELQLGQKEISCATQASCWLGNIYRSEGRFDLAAAQYNRALEGAISVKPEQVKQLRFNLGTTFEAQGEVRKAIKIYEAILQDDIDFGNLAVRIERLKSTSLKSMRIKQLALVIAAYGKNEIVAVWGRERVSQAERREEVNLSFGQEHNHEGFDYFMKGMYQAAAEEFALACSLDPGFAVAINNLAVVLTKQGRLEEARLKVMEAVAINPASAVCYNNLGAIYFLLGKVDQARVALEKSYSFDRLAAAINLNLGDFYYFIRETKKAIELYRQVGSFDPLSDLVEQRLLYKVP